MKKTFSILLVFVYFTISAQNYVDLARFSYANTPLNNFENNLNETSIEEFNLQLLYPIVLDSNTTLLTGLSANTAKLKLDFNVPSISLNSIGLKLGLKKVYSEKWSGTYMLLPKISSEFNSFSKEDFQLGLFTLFTFTKKENLKYKVGIYANTEKFGPMIVPLLGLYYLSPNNKFEANATLPISFDLNYKLFKETGLGISFSGLTKSFNLNKSTYTANNEYVVVNSNELFTYLQFQLGKSLLLNTKAGYAISRSNKVFDSNDKIDLAVSSIYLGDNRTQLNQNIETGAIFKIELLYRFQIK